MEITIDRHTIYATLALLVLLGLLGLAALGRSFSPAAETGATQILRWNDWQLTKAGRRFESERASLRSEADALSGLLNRSPDPVAAEYLSQRIGRSLSRGEAALQTARTALLQAAQDVAAWSAGALDRDTAFASLQAAAALLK